MVRSKLRRGSLIEVQEMKLMGDLYDTTGGQKQSWKVVWTKEHILLYC
jgi:hypothetical protein